MKEAGKKAEVQKEGSQEDRKFSGWYRLNQCKHGSVCCVLTDRVGHGHHRVIGAASDAGGRLGWNLFPPLQRRGPDCHIAPAAVLDGNGDSVVDSRHFGMIWGWKSEGSIRKGRVRGVSRGWFLDP